MSDYLVRATNVTKHFVLSPSGFGRTEQIVRAVDGVDFRIKRGRTLGLVGESGCGKTTIGRLLLYLESLTDGEIEVGEFRLSGMARRNERAFRRSVQAVFQDPYGALSPRQRVFNIIAEPLRVQGGHSRAELSERVEELLHMVGLPAGSGDRYPHEFSGGQRQRIAVARAISVNPELLVLDEPTSALDVSVRAQTLNLLRSLQDRFGLTYLFVAHDLAVVEFMSDEIKVMYLGKVVESGSAAKLCREPGHPYTQALMRIARAMHQPGAISRHPPLEGEIPSPLNPPSGCRFRTRCPYAQTRCSEEEPELLERAPGHLVACHFFETISAASGHMDAKTSN